MEHATGNWKKARGSSPIHCQLQTFSNTFPKFTALKMMLNCSNKTIQFIDEGLKRVAFYTQNVFK